MANDNDNDGYQKADLYEWIKPLDAIDAALNHLLDANPSLLLIGRQKEPKSALGAGGSSTATATAASRRQQAESVADAASVPAPAVEAVRTILRFLSGLLRNSYNKAVFNSLSELSDLLAASDESASALALDALCQLSIPPLLHRQQQPELMAHSTALHAAGPGHPVHGRLLALARGGGSRATGLGLYACVTAGDGIAGGTSLLPSAIPGEIHFECYLDGAGAGEPLGGTRSGVGGSGSDGSGSGSDSGSGSGSHLIRLNVPTEEVLASPPPHPPSPSRQVEKRRRTGSKGDPPTFTRQRSDDRADVAIRSTAELFFACLDKIGADGKGCGDGNGGGSGSGDDANARAATTPSSRRSTILPPDMQFALLADIRLSRSYHTRPGRVDAVQRRLMALIAILQSHPSQDVLLGYFHAQPELCAELADLVRPTVAGGRSHPPSAPAGDGGNCSPSAAAGGDSDGDGEGSSGSEDVLANISGGDESAASEVPYRIRSLAVEAMTALIGRRDGSSGGLSNIARSLNALGELGVAKGQFFGLLPALIRFTLSSLSTFMSQHSATGGPEAMDTDEPAAATDVTNTPTSSRTLRVPQHEQEERMLEFIDIVLSLTSSVVSLPTGTSALTDCGLIPALVQTVSRDLETAKSVSVKSPFTLPPGDEGTTRGTAYVDSLLKFVSAQAIQILEAAVVTHSSALIAFHELEGVELLVKRLNLEIEQIKQAGSDSDGDGDVEMKDAKSQEESSSTNDGNNGGDNSNNNNNNNKTRPLTASRRVILFSLTNCLTVIFHQQDSSSSSAVTPSGAAQLRKPELTNVVIDVLSNISGYGGVLGSLVSTLLADVMNSDPQVVHYVHESGIAAAFFNMVKGEAAESTPLLDNSSSASTPNLPAAAELIMSVSNVISALALTEKGAVEVRNANPFPALLDIFSSPKYVMPTSRCLLNEMGAIVGTGLDEIIRHVPTLSGKINEAIVRTLSKIVSLGRELVEKEKDVTSASPSFASAKEVEDLRTYLLQYSYNMSQLLEQILHQESHCGTFVQLGGLDALLELFPLLIPTGSHFLSHISCMTGPSFAKISHLTNSSALTLAIRNISSNIDSQKMIGIIIDRMEKHFETLQVCQNEYWRRSKKAREERSGLADENESGSSTSSGSDSIYGILDGVPRVPIHMLDDSEVNSDASTALSNYMRQFVVTEWLTNLLTSSIRAAQSKSSELGSSGWGRTEKEWKKLLSSEKFEGIADKLSALHRDSIQEVCRIRTEDGYDQREEDRRMPPGTPGNTSHPALYRLRIVCAEGAVVRNGIDIDSSASVGGLEIGEVIEATERCINASGVMRYRTRSGWVSEQTRGHGREPIAEVLEIRGVAAEVSQPPSSSEVTNTGAASTPRDAKKRKRVECGVTDLCSASASIMARMQHCRTSLFSCLSRIVCVSGARSMQYYSSSLSLDEGTAGAHVSSLAQSLSRNIRDDFAVDGATEAIAISLSEGMHTNANESAASAHVTMYLGCMLTLLHSTLLEERGNQTREAYNLFLLYGLLSETEVLEDGQVDGKMPSSSSGTSIDSGESVGTDLPAVGFVGAIRFVLSEALADMQRRAFETLDNLPEQKLSRCTAASLPPAMALLRCLASKSIISNDSPTGNVLGQMTQGELVKFLGIEDARTFHMGRFFRSLYMCVGSIALEMWKDDRLASAPAHVIHPTLRLLIDVMTSLKFSTECTSVDQSSDRASRSRSSATSTLNDAISNSIGRVFGGIGDSGAGAAAAAARRAPRGPFEPSEETITRLAEMGFDRDHALEALETMQSNRLEVAMEYCLSHPPPSPATAARRQAEREAAAASRANQGQQESGTNSNGDDNDASNEVGSASSGEAATAAAPAAAAAVVAPKDGTGDGGASMDVDESGPKEKELSEEEKKEREEKRLNEISHARTKKCLDAMKADIIPGALRVIEGQRSHVDQNKLSDKSRGDCDNSTEKAQKRSRTEDENTVLVVCQFLLDLCKSDPSQRTDVVVETLGHLKSMLAVNGKRTTVADNKEREFASLCYATVILLRALPRARPILLQHGLVGSLMSCLRSVVASKTGGWPRWVAPSVLLLDVMAQPSSASVELDDDDSSKDDGNDDENDSKKTGGDESKKPSSKAATTATGIRLGGGDDAKKLVPSKEFTRLREEQKKKTAALSKATYQIFSAVSGSPNKDNGTAKKKKADGSGGKTETGAAGTSTAAAAAPSIDGTGTSESAPNGDGSKAEVSFPSIPSYTPLLLPEAAESCMHFCLQVLRRSVNGGKSAVSVQSSLPPSDVVQAVLLLLSRVLRSHKVASQCLKSGGAELICSLPKDCRFDGNTAATTMILRRMLEDPSTLQTLMQTDIRATLANLSRQPRGLARTGATTKPVPLRAFLDKMASLISRDPLIFVKAAASSIKIVLPSPDQTGIMRTSTSKQILVELLPTDVRAKNSKIVAEKFAVGGNGGPHNHGGDREKRQSLTGAPGSAKRGRSATKTKPSSKEKDKDKVKPPKSSTPSKSTSPRRASRRSLSPKKDSQRKQIALNGTPANHITALLFTEMVKSYDQRSASSGGDAGSSFLTTVEYLEILSDLSLAVPACAAAIHKYRPKKYAITHALSGGPPPSNSGVNFLLHVLLPQNRPTIPKEPRDTDGTPDEVKTWKAQRKAAYDDVRLVQTSARLLVALVARAGEGRRRVIVELASALTGTNAVIATAAANVPNGRSGDNESRHMWALQSWGELCLGLAAPRSTSTSQDGNSTLSFEVVRLMLECGMAHAVMNAIGQVKLYHPQASTTAASLLRPLEIFSRSSVTDKVMQIIKDDESKKKKTKTSPSVASTATGNKERGASDAALHEDAMIEDDFHANGAQGFANDDSDSDSEIESDGDGWEEDRSSEEGSNSMNEDSMSDSMDRDSEDDEMDRESSDSMDEDDSEGESSSSDGIDNGLDDAIDEDDSDDSMIDDDDMDDDEIEDNAFFEGQGDTDFEFGRLPQPGDGNAEEGWVNVAEGIRAQNAALGAAIGGALEELGDVPGQGGGDGGGARAGGGLEAMLRNIGQGGDASMENLADLEMALGARITNQLESLMDRLSGGMGGGAGMAPPMDPLAGYGAEPPSQGTEEGQLRSMDRGPMGSVPLITQCVAPEMGSTTRSYSFSFMEYMYGGPVVGTGGYGRYYAPSADDGNDEEDSTSNVSEVSVRIPPTVSTIMFPNGPVASTHVRRPHLPHPLLRDVMLGPINALVPSTRRFAEIQSRSGPGGFGRGGLVSNVVMSDGHGNVIRHTNPRRIGDSTSRGAGGVFGWTEDDRAPEASLGAEFENALREVTEQANARAADASGDGATATATASSRTASTDQASQAVDQSGDAASEAQESVEAQNDGAEAAASSSVNNNELPSAETNVNNSTSADAANADVQMSGTSAAGQPGDNTGAENGSDNVSEGDNVASSLDQIRLSSSTSSSGGQRQGAENDERSAQQDASAQEDTEMQEAESTQGNSGSSEPARADGEDPSLSVSQQGQQDESVSPPTEEDSSAAAPAAGTSSGSDEASEGGGGGEAAAASSGDGSAAEAAPAETAADASGGGNAPNEFGLVCPPGMDPDVFNSLPLEMQQEVVAQHQSTYESAAEQLDAASGLDPEALAALPEDMRREVIEQERQERERRERESAPADPSNAQEMDNASFLVSLAPELREEVLLTADDAFLASLPQSVQAEAQVLRERQAFGIRQHQAQQAAAAAAAAPANARAVARAPAGAAAAQISAGSSSSRKKRVGRMKVECDRESIIFVPSTFEEKIGPVMTATSMKALVRLMFLLSPVRPHRLLQKVFQNLIANGRLRATYINTFVALLNGDNAKALGAVNALDSGLTDQNNSSHSGSGREEDFPPLGLIGTAPAMELDSSSSSLSSRLFSRQNAQQSAHNAAAAIASNIPMSSRHSLSGGLPPILAKRIIDFCIHMAKHVPRLNFDVLKCNEEDSSSKTGISPSCILDHLLDLLNKPLYLKSSTVLEHLLCMLEGVCSPLSLLPKEGEEAPKLTEAEIDSAAASKKEWLDVPKPVVTHQRLKLLCSILKLEYVKDSSFTRVNSICRRLSRVEDNRHFILTELTGVANVLAEGAVKDLRELSVRLTDQVDRMNAAYVTAADGTDGQARNNSQHLGLSSSTTESKLLRVLQALSVLTAESQGDAKKSVGLLVASPELVALMQSPSLMSLWNELTSCLRLVSILEGVDLKEESEKADDGNGNPDNSAHGGGGRNRSESVGSALEDNSGHGSTAAGEDGTAGDGGKKLQKSVAGVLTRFLPSIEAFFVVNGVKMPKQPSKSPSGEEGDGNQAKCESNKKDGDTAAVAALASDDDQTKDLEQQQQQQQRESEHQPDPEAILVSFVATNKILLNALIRSNPSLLEKGLRAMAIVPGCRPFLDFDVKRQWFRTCLRRLRQHASRRHGGLRLHIRRKHVFEDAYHQLTVRNAEEMRGRLSITFRDEEGVDAGGLSREFFAILAKEMFNPNYALFTSTEDGCTFQPNPNSSINPDHLHYFRFVGRIVGKAISDGYLLDAHFTRSLYKHMLGVKPTHHDMEAIDPDYYKNLKLILEHNLDDIGLELTFSIEDHSFGRLQTIDLLPNGRNIKVTEESKEQYVSLVCQHRMTTSIKSQIKAFLEGFHEMVRPELIAIFTAKELELLISGLPDIDIFDLKKHTTYQGYRSTDKEMEWFWNVMTSLTRSQKAAFLQFVTGSSKVPLNGFAELQGMRGIQRFSIHRVGASSALPAAHTCFNQLDLPVYQNEEELKEKLLLAIEEGAGSFEFA